MSAGALPLTGFGIGWRPEIDLTVERLTVGPRPGVDFVEAVAENLDPRRLPVSLRVLRERGVAVVPHGVSLSLGGAERPDPVRLAHLAACATALDAPLVSEHVAFTRATGPAAGSSDSGLLDAGHLLPLPRTRDALAVLVENVRIARDQLPVPLALENIAPLFSWPEDEMTEGEFLSELAERSGALLLLDVANLHTARVNLGSDPAEVLGAVPLERIGYVHVAGGIERNGVWHDTHTHPLTEPVLRILADLAARCRRAAVPLPGVLLERDGDYPSDAEIAAELAMIRAAAAASSAAADVGHG